MQKFGPIMNIIKLGFVSRKILFLKFKSKKDFGRATSKAITSQLRNSERNWRNWISENSILRVFETLSKLDERMESIVSNDRPNHGELLPRSSSLNAATRVSPLFSSLPIGSELDQSDDRITIVDSGGPFKFDRVESLHDESENWLETSLTFSISQS